MKPPKRRQLQKENQELRSRVYALESQLERLKHQLQYAEAQQVGRTWP